MCGQGNQLKLANIVNILLKEKPFSLINFDRVPDVSKHAWSPFLVLHHVVVDFRFCLSPLVYPSRAGSVARYSVGVLCSSTYERTEPKQQIFPNTHKTLPQKRLTWLISVSLVFLNSLANYRKSRLCLFFFLTEYLFWRCSNFVLPIFQHVGPTSSTCIVIVMDIVHDNEDNQTVVTSCIKKCWILRKGAQRRTKILQL